MEKQIGSSSPLPGDISIVLSRDLDIPEVDALAKALEDAVREKVVFNEQPMLAGTPAGIIEIFANHKLLAGVAAIFAPMWIGFIQQLGKSAGEELYKRKAEITTSILELLRAPEANATQRIIDTLSALKARGGPGLTLKLGLAATPPLRSATVTVFQSDAASIAWTLANLAAYAREIQGVLDEIERGPQRGQGDVTIYILDSGGVEVHWQAYRTFS